MDITWAIILAAGTGSRMGDSCGGMPKQFLIWKGRPLYWHSALAMSRSAAVDGLVFVFAEKYVERERQRVAELAELDNLGLPFQVVVGGERRQDSSGNGLQAVPMLCDKVLIHDAARPFATPALVRRVAGAVTREQPCVVPGVAVSDTIKQLDPTDRTLAKVTLPRSDLIACQTPQGFWTSCLRTAIGKKLDVTDDAMLMEAMGHNTVIVPGEPGNIKITTAEELHLLQEDKPQALSVTGFGYDVHRFGSGRPLKLGGIAIPSELEVIAHSDGDVLLHALMDSLLGLASLGDIGRHFPDTDPRYENISSAVLLSHILDLVRDKGITVTHVDLTVVAQKPRLAPYAEEIRGNIARLMTLDKDCVNFKATTEEKLGFSGRGEGIKAYSLASGIK